MDGRNLTEKIKLGASVERIRDRRYDIFASALFRKNLISANKCKFNTWCQIASEVNAMPTVP